MPALQEWMRECFVQSEGELIGQIAALAVSAFRVERFAEPTENGHEQSCVNSKWMGRLCNRNVTDRQHTGAGRCTYR